MTTNAVAISSVHRRRPFARNPPTAPLPLTLNSIHGAFISVLQPDYAPQIVLRFHIEPTEKDASGSRDAESCRCGNQVVTLIEMQRSECQSRQRRCRQKSPTGCPEQLSEYETSENQFLEESRDDYKRKHVIRRRFPVETADDRIAGEHGDRTQHSEE